jgi:hypothetical protein
VFYETGFWSSLKKVVAAIPDVVNTAQTVAQYLPFQAGPQIPQQFAPQSWGGWLPSQLQQAIRSLPPTYFTQSPYQAVGQA